MFNYLEAKFNQFVEWFHARVLPNPSGQDQVHDHLFPLAAECLFLTSIPKVGVFLGLALVAGALYREFVEDGHWHDFFASTPSGQDGRVDLFFRLVGCGLGFLPLFWR